MLIFTGISTRIITCTTWQQQRRVAPQWLSASAPPSGRPPRPRTAAPSLVQKPLQEQIIMFTLANHMCLPTSCILNFIASIPLVRTFKLKMFSTSWNLDKKKYFLKLSWLHLLIAKPTSALHMLWQFFCLPHTWLPCPRKRDHQDFGVH